MSKIYEEFSSRIKRYADEIVNYFGDFLQSFQYEDYDDFAQELDEAIKNGIVSNIPQIDREDAFKAAIDVVNSSEYDDYDDSMDGDHDSTMKSIGWGNDEDYGYYGDNDFFESVINDTHEIIKLLNESLASRKAKKLGLHHIGFGNYSKKPGGAAQYKTVDGKLRRIGWEMPKPKKSEEEKGRKKGDDDEKKDKKPKQKGITDVQRVSGEKFTYKFKKDGKQYKFTLTKDERKEFKGEGSIMHIIKKRLKKKEDAAKAKKLKKGKSISLKNSN